MNKGQKWSAETRRKFAATMRRKKLEKARQKTADADRLIIHNVYNGGPKTASAFGPGHRKGKQPVEPNVTVLGKVVGVTPRAIAEHVIQDIEGLGIYTLAAWRTDPKLRHDVRRAASTLLDALS